jgi:hypothetical protein
MLFRSNSDFDPIHYDYEIPIEWRSKVCICNGPSLYSSVKPKRIFTGKAFSIPGGTCSECNNPGVHLLNECMMCEKVFLKDFHHPAFNWASPYCWDCLEEYVPDAVCTNYPEKLQEIHLAKGKIPPPDLARKQQLEAYKPTGPVFSFDL